MNNNSLPAELEEIGRAVINAAFKVHKNLGPGHLEKVYEVCVAHELRKAGYNVKRQVHIPIEYDGIEFDEGLRLDLLIHEKVIVELKTVCTSTFFRFLLLFIIFY